MVSAFSSKYFEILKTLSESELKSLDSWLNSSWCNSNKNLITLLDKVKKYYPDFNNDRLTKERLFKQVLPKGKYSDRRMNNLLSEGYQATEKFIIFQKLSQDKKLQKDLLSQEFQGRHLEDWFFRDIQKEITRLEEKEVKDWEDHLDLLRLSRRMYHHPNQNPRMQSGGETIVKMGEQLDLVYLLEKAAIINEKIVRNRIVKAENHEIEAELEKWRCACKNIQHPALIFYKMRFAYTEENRAEQYFKIKKAFLEQYETLNLKEQKIHLINLLNDTALLVKRSKIAITELFPLYKLGLETEIILHQGTLTRSNYSSIVVVSNTKHEFSFTQKFIKEYTCKLEENIREEAREWANAHTAYYQENYDECLNILVKYNPKDIIFQRIGKFLTIQVYFDLYLTDASYQEYTLSYLDAVEKWIRREKLISDKIKKSYISFIQVCRVLIKTVGDVDMNRKKIASLLDKEDNIQGLEWLNRKISHVLSLKK